jgi:hypothetical protein
MNIYVDKYVDEKGNADNQLSLNSDGYSYLTEDLEDIISKYTGTEEWIKDSSSWNEMCEIRLNLMDLIHSIVNKEEVSNVSTSS